MPTQKSTQVGTSRLGVFPDTSSRDTTSTRLPTRTGLPMMAPSTTYQRPIPTPSPSSRLARQSSTRASHDSEGSQAGTSVRSTQRSGASRLAIVDEMRKETPSSMPGRLRYAAMDKQRVNNPPFAPSRLEAPDDNRTPSLVSGSSASTNGSPQSILNVQRKASANRSFVGRVVSTKKPSSQNLEATHAVVAKRTYSDAPAVAAVRSAMPRTDQPRVTEEEETVIQLDQYVSPLSYVPSRLIGPTPPYVLVNTPSTNYSPGPFSISSTPSSMSSFSSTQPVAGPSLPHLKLQTPSPGVPRPVMTRNRTNDSAASSNGASSSVTQTSSSSTSTVRHDKNLKGASKPSTSASEGGLAKTAGRIGTSHRMPRSSSRARPSDPTPTLRIFPELAHLNDASPRKNSLPNATPVRPSRNGTEGIGDSETSTVVQSNMASLPATASPHRRQVSSELKRSVAAALTIDPVARFAIPKSIRLPSPSPCQASTKSPLTSRPPTRGSSPDHTIDRPGSSKLKSSTPVNSGKSFSRFGFFSKKAKPDEKPNVLTKEKSGRKGPVAGTGHEGYGKFSNRGRSGSTTSGSGGMSVGRSPSMESTPGPAKGTTSRKSSVGSKTSEEIDEFLTDKLAPVTIRGNGRPSLERAHTTGTTLLPAEAAARGLGTLTISSGAQGSLQQGGGKRPVLLPSPIPDHHDSPVKKAAIQTAVNTVTITSVNIPPNDKRFPRRSMSNSADVLTSTIKSEQVAKGSENECLPSELADISEGKEGNWLKSRKAENPLALDSLKAPKKWNFFQRTRSPVRQVKPQPQQQVQPSPPHESVTVTVARQLPQRSVAHYEFDPAPKCIDMQELEEIMREAEETSPEEIDRSYQPSIAQPAVEKKAAQHDSFFLTDPPSFDPSKSSSRVASPKLPAEDLISPQQPTTVSSNPIALAQLESVEPPAAPVFPMGDAEPRQRQPRLQQVGRIPKVISTKRIEGHQRKLSDNSFSRPFAPSQPSPALRTSFGNALDVTISRSPELRKAPQFPPVTQLIVPSPETSLTTPNESAQSSRINSSDLEYIRLKGRQYAERSSDSSSCQSIPISASLALLATQPPISIGDEDVWGEYDEFIDALSPLTPKTPKSAVSTSSSAGAPFHYAATLAAHSSPIPIPNLPLPQEALPEPPSSSHPRLLAIAQKIRIPSSSYDLRYLSTMPSVISPNSPMSVSEMLNGCRASNTSIIDSTTGRISLPSQDRFSTRSSRHSLPVSLHARSSTHSKRTTRPPSDSMILPQRRSTRRDSRLIERAENANMGFESMANLRFGALMTSKWLSFGRVLFSPIHFQMQEPGANRILILDGLGKDWSFYVAQTYQQACIYNLGPEPAGMTSSRLSQPVNHRHIIHPSLTATFPFPKGFFAAVVFRFPVATTEHAYRTALFECKRVLRPGGYLEVSTLDIDMMNMGNRARRAVRQLKMDMQVEDPAISLKPLSDTMQRLIGRRGFENLSRCFVGIPAAGCIPSSREDSITDVPKSTGDDETSPPSPPSTADTPSNPKTPTLPTNPAKRLTIIADSPQESTQRVLPSFSDILRDQSQGSEEEMTKMVARVARWWYMRCYESTVLPDADVSKSIWADEALRKECERRGTSLRLMVLFAQKPVVVVRRTCSV